MFLIPNHNGWGYCCPLCHPGGGSRIPQPKPVDGFSPNFQDVLPQDSLELFRIWQVFGNNSLHWEHLQEICFLLTQENLELINFWRVSGNSCCHGNTFKILDLNLCGCPTA